jgi:non-specific serine/threonine protein kinase
MAYGWFSEDRMWLGRLLPKVTEPSPVRLNALHAACWLAVLQGDREGAASLLGEVRDLAPRLEEPAPSRADQLTGWHELFLGDLAAAVEHLERAVAGFRGSGWTADLAETLVLLGMAYGFAGDHEQAARAHEECLRVCSDGANAWARSYALQWGGLVAWERGEHQKALTWELESLQLKRQMQERLGVALCLEALARIECADAPERAAIMLGAAASLFTTIGTSPAALPGLLSVHEASEAALKAEVGDTAFEKAFDEGVAMSADAAIAFALDEQASSEPASDGEPGSGELGSTVLTRREREIALLIGEGLSNRDIASRLVISTRTAEGHVEHILTKLGFTSRAQVAAWVASREGVLRTR